jgi:hypothetical protein
MACLGQTLWLITKIVNYGCKKFCNTRPRWNVTVSGAISGVDLGPRQLADWNVPEMKNAFPAKTVARL